MPLEFRVGDKANYYGHHFVVRLSGPRLSEQDKRLLGKLHPAGVTLGRDNFCSSLSYESWFKELVLLISSAKEYCERERLIVAIDQEGGRFNSAPSPYTDFAAAKKYAPYAAEVAGAMAVELRALGVNLSWAPVADIHSNPENPVIGERAFGSEAEYVAERALEFSRELQKGGIAPCAKHFPGHGDTEVDSHLELPVLGLTARQLSRRELIPFAALIESGIPLIMTAHILFPRIDPDVPATLSERIMLNILRDELGFKGVAVADDIGMQAIAPFFKRAPAMGRLLKVGCDLVIVGSGDAGEPSGIELARRLAECLNGGEIDEDTLYNSYSRINDLFERHLRDPRPEMLSEEVFKEHALLLETIRAGNC